MGRWFARRAAAIKCVHVSANLYSHLHDKQGSCQAVIESQLPFLAGALSQQVNVMHLTFLGGSPFRSPLFSSPRFLSVLCPLVKELELRLLSNPVARDQFEAICHLSNLEVLDISVDSDDSGAEDGLQEMTSDISKLVNLQDLRIEAKVDLLYLPEAISCLQKLDSVWIQAGSISGAYAGLGSLTTLSELSIVTREGLHEIPTHLGWKSLTHLQLRKCSLSAIPEAFSSLSALEELDLSSNCFATDNLEWWPTSLSRLTQLVLLNLGSCGIQEIPAGVSAFVGLTALLAGKNRLRSLPNELCSLRNLERLDLDHNYLPAVPVSVLSGLMGLRELRLGLQHQSEGYPNFGISSPLLPIIHPGLKFISLKQDVPWDLMSMFHIGCAVAHVADWRPMPTLEF